MIGSEILFEMRDPSDIGDNPIGESGKFLPKNLPRLLFTLFTRA